ncbi:hypothetical protein ACLB2K_057448 [Fragaria x ananassa]
MASAIASLSSSFQAASSNLLLSNSSRLKIGIERGAATKDDHSYLVGRLLGPKDRFPGFKGTISTIWRVKKGLSVSDAGDHYVFQFDRVSVRNQVFHGGLCHYKNTMLVLGEYDGRGDPAAVPLNLLETWVDVQGLRHLLRNPMALRMVGTGLGRVIRFDPQALKRKEEIQRIRLEFDVRRRIRVWQG